MQLWACTKSGDLVVWDTRNPKESRVQQHVKQAHQTAIRSICTIEAAAPSASLLTTVEIPVAAQTAALPGDAQSRSVAGGYVITGGGSLDGKIAVWRSAPLFYDSSFS